MDETRASELANRIRVCQSLILEAYEENALSLRSRFLGTPGRASFIPDDASELFRKATQTPEDVRRELSDAEPTLTREQLELRIQQRPESNAFLLEYAASDLEDRLRLIRREQRMRRVVGDAGVLVLIANATAAVAVFVGAFGGMDTLESVLALAMIVVNSVALCLADRWRGD